MAEEGKGTTVLEFDGVKTVMIWNPTGKGVLFERRRNQKSRLLWRNYLTGDNKGRALVWVYSYKSSPPADGTYVVLEFAKSGNFIYGGGIDAAPQLYVGEPDDVPVDPEDLTTPTDPRVFLMKGSKNDSRDVVFIWKGYTNDIITVLPPPKNRPSGPCGLKPEGNGPTLESQDFQLNLPLLRKADGASEAETEMLDRLEVVPDPFPRGRESEARQAQKTQRHH